MKRLKITIQGATPLLMNQMPMEVLEGIRLKQKKTKSAPRPKDPRDEAEPKVYQTSDGKPYIPAENLMSAMIAAGVFIRLDGKRQLSTSKTTLVPGYVTLEDPVLVLKTPDGKTPDWTVDMRQGKNPNGGEAVCIVRPRFDVWGFSTSMLVDDEALSLDQYRELIDIAIQKIGLCDYRPQCKGIYGRSFVTSWKVEEMKRAA